MASDITHPEGPHDMAATPLTTGDVAHRLGCPEWKVARLYERGLLPEPARFGRFRVIDEADLPIIEAALRDAGYLRRPARETVPA